MREKLWLHTTKKLARVAETSSIEHFSKIKFFASIEVYDKNATLANFQPVVRHAMAAVLTLNNGQNEKNTYIYRQI